MFLCKLSLQKRASGIVDRELVFYPRQVEPKRRPRISFLFEDSAEKDEILATISIFDIVLTMPSKTKPLTQIAFSILLVLSPVPRHGYDIMKQVKEDTGGRLNIGPGSLYGTIKQLLAERLIEEVKDHTDTERRRYYQLTDKGKEALQAELRQYEATLRIAENRRLFIKQKQELV